MFLRYCVWILGPKTSSIHILEPGVMRLDHLETRRICLSLRTDHPTTAPATHSPKISSLDSALEGVDPWIQEWAEYTSILEETPIPPVVLPDLPMVVPVEKGSLEKSLIRQKRINARLRRLLRQSKKKVHLLTKNKQKLTEHCKDCCINLNLILERHRTELHRFCCLRHVDPHFQTIPFGCSTSS